MEDPENSGDVGYSIVVARNLGLGKKDRERINPSIEKFLKQIIDMNGLDLSNTINVALENHLRKHHYITPEALERLGCVSKLEKNIFEYGIDSTAAHVEQKGINLLLQQQQQALKSQ